MLQIGELMELTPKELNQGQALLVFDLVYNILNEVPKDEQFLVKLNDGSVLESVDFIYATKDGKIKANDIAILVNNVGVKRYRPIEDKVETMRNLTPNSYTEIIIKGLRSFSKGYK